MDDSGSGPQCGLPPNPRALSPELCVYAGWWWGGEVGGKGWQISFSGQRWVWDSQWHFSTPRLSFPICKMGVFAPEPFWVADSHLSGSPRENIPIRRPQEDGVHTLGSATSHTPSPGSPGAPEWPPEGKRLWKSGCGGAPSAGQRRKCLLDCLLPGLGVQPH